MIFDKHGNPAPRFIPPPRPECVGTHHMPANWRTAGTDERGLVKIVAKCCRRFVGYQRPPTKKETEREATQAMGDES